MHIFIDESGTFSCSETKAHSISAVGALTIPSAAMPGFEKLYGRLRYALPKDGGEVKGRRLSEKQVLDVVGVLKKVGALFEIVAIDMGQHTEETIRSHKTTQEQAITQHLTDEHHPNVVEAVWEMRRTLEALPLQLYVQSVAMGDLVYWTINLATTYFSLRRPQEIGEFHWTIDAKDKSKLTPWEKWWSMVILPMIESRSMREPFIRIEGGDYRWQERFRTELGDYKKQFVKNADSGEVFDLRPVLQEHLKFSSEPEYGLEAVDILTNGVRRSMSGNFAREGWIGIRKLMIHRNDQYIRLISLNSDAENLTNLPYANVINDFRKGGKPLGTPSFYRGAEN